MNYYDFVIVLEALAREFHGDEPQKTLNGMLGVDKHRFAAVVAQLEAQGRLACSK